MLTIINNPDSSQIANDNIMSSFTVGEQVNVEARTWPGINKPGGVGKVVKIHTEGPGIVVAVDVRYILGGTEKEVELQYVQKHEELNRGGRSRSRREVMNLGPEESNEKPRRSAATKSKKPSPEADSSTNAGSAKKKKAPAKKAASSSSKRKPAKKEDASTKKRKADASKGKSASVAGKKATSTMTPPTSTAVSQSDSDSVVVSADESEISSANKPPAAAIKKAVTTSSRQSQPEKKAAVASSEFDSRSMPPPPPPAAFASSKPASKFSMQPQHPKLKNVDRKNTSAVGGSAAASAKIGQSTLQKVHESNSRAASSFVDAIVGGAEAAAPATQPAAAAAASAAAAITYPDDVSTVLCVGDEQSTVTGAHTRSTSSGPLSVDAQ